MLIFYYKYWCLSSRPSVSPRRNTRSWAQVANSGAIWNRKCWFSIVNIDVWARNLVFRLDEALGRELKWPTGLRRDLDQKVLIFYCKYWCLSSRPPFSSRQDESKCHQVLVFSDRNECASCGNPQSPPSVSWKAVTTPQCEHCLGNLDFPISENKN